VDLPAPRIKVIKGRAPGEEQEEPYAKAQSREKKRKRLIFASEIWGRRKVQIYFFIKGNQ